MLYVIKDLQILLYGVRFEVELKDDSGPIIATMFGDIAEKMISIAAPRLMKHRQKVQIKFINQKELILLWKILPLLMYAF